MTFGLHSAPLLAILTILLATLLRGSAIKRSTGDRPWAFASAKGVQRLAGSSFAVSVTALAVASGLAEGRLPLGLAATVLAVSTAGAAIVIAAQVQMGRAWRIGIRHGDAPLFVSHGLFRYSRNPIFVGMIMVGLGAALVSATWWGWTALVIFVGACIAQVRIEEAHLDASFGDAYRAFRSSVPRWLGLGTRR